MAEAGTLSPANHELGLTQPPPEPTGGGDRTANVRNTIQACWQAPGADPQWPRITGALARGACVRRDQPLGGIWQSVMPRYANERYTDVHWTGTGQHLSRSLKAVSQANT
jgi:hypothetical protein